MSALDSCCKDGTGMKRLTFLMKGNEDDWEVEGANSSCALGRGGSEF